MPHSNKREAQLRREFPFLGEVLASPLLLRSPSRSRRDGSGNKIDVLDIKIERADASLMYRRAENFGLGPDDDNYLIAIRKVGGKDVHVVGQRQELLFAVTVDGARIVPQSWPIGNRRRTRYARDIFTAMPPDQVAYLVWVKVTNQYHELVGRAREATPFGEFIDRHVHVTIYGAPALGFKYLWETATLGDSHLTTRELMHGLTLREPEWIAVAEELNKLTQAFNAAVYQAGMRSLMDASTRRGMSGTFGGIALRSFISAGRVWVAIEESDVCDLAFVGLEESRHLRSAEGITGTLPNVRSMVDRLAEAWRATPNKSAVFVSDDAVSPYPW